MISSYILNKKMLKCRFVLNINTGCMDIVKQKPVSIVKDFCKCVSQNS